MFRRTFTGALVAASLTAGAFVSMPAAQADPAWVGGHSVSGLDSASDADVAVADDGSAVATWLQDGRIMAASAAHGQWGAPRPVSADGSVVNYPTVAVNEHGDAVVAWPQDVDGKFRLTVSRRLPSGAWSADVPISPADGLETFDVPAIALDASGTLRAAYVVTDNADLSQVRVATQAKASGTYTTTTMSDTDADSPSLAVNAAGAVLASWRDVEGLQSRIQSRRQPAPAAPWDVVKEVAPLGTHPLGTDTVLSSTGFGAVAFARVLGSDSRLMSAKMPSNGVVGVPAYVSPSETDVTDFDLDQNDAGAAVLGWTFTHDGLRDVGYATRTMDGSWMASEIDAPVAQPLSTRAGIADDGSVVIGYSGNGHLLASHRVNSFLPLEHHDFGDLGIATGDTLLGMDDQGNAFLGTVRGVGDQEEVRGWFLDVTAPTAWMAAPTAAQVVGTSLGVTWRATDRTSATTGTVRVRSAAWNGGFSGYSHPLVNSASTSFVHHGKPGRTYCFSSQARDAAAHLSPWSAERCTTVPLDDRSLTRVKGFQKHAGKAHYRGTFVQATRKGSKLTLTGVTAGRLALVVSRVAQGGKVKVTFAGQDLGTWSLKGRGSKKVLALKTFGALQTGKLVIKVVSSTGKVVRIDGVVAAR